MRAIFSKSSLLYRHLVLIVTLNIPIIFLLLLRNLLRVEFTPMTWLYLFFVTVGYYALSVLFLITLTYLIGFWSRRFALGLSVALVTVFIFFLLIDGQTYSITSIHINSFWLEWIINDFEGFGLPKSTIAYALLALLAIAVIEIGVLYLATRFTKPKVVVLPIWGLVLVSLAASQLMHVVTYENNDARITSLTPHLPVYRPVTSHSNVSRFENIITDGDEDSPILPESFDGDLNYPLAEIKCSVTDEKTLPNIVLIFLESWRFDMLNEEVTPNIYELSKSSTTNTNHFCSGNSTVAGTFGLFYGISPTYWTAVKSNNAAINNPVFIDILINYGYQFGVFAKSNFKRHKLKDTIFRGIDVFENFSGSTIMEQDRDLTDRFKMFLREQREKSKPFFGFAFYKSNHAPYLYPEEDSVFLPAADENLMLTNDNTDPARYLNDYRNSTHYVDRLVGEVIDELEVLDMMSNTIVIVTTDHGEQFNDNNNNFWGHGSNYTKYQTLVPLVFYAPGKEPKLLEFPTAHIDIAPTIIDEYFGCSNPVSDYSSGINIFKAGPDLNRPFVIGSYVNYAFVIEDNVYEIYPVYTKEYKFADIKKSASAPSFEMLRTIVQEMGRFYREKHPAK